MKIAKKKNSQLKVITQLKEDIWGKYQKKKLRVYKKKKKFHPFEEEDNDNTSMRKKDAIRHLYAFLKYHGDVKEKVFRNAITQNHPILEMATSKAPDIYECHLTMVLYRMNLINTIFQAKELIMRGLVKVNGNVISNTNYFLKPGDVVSLEKKVLLPILKNMRALLRNNKLITDTPRYLLLNIRTLSCSLWRFPFFNEAPYAYPFGFVTAPGIILNRY